MKTLTEIRNAFWDAFPQFQTFRRTKKRQNDYHTDIRCAFVEYIDTLQKGGYISEKLAAMATL